MKQKVMASTFKSLGFLLTMLAWMASARAQLTVEIGGQGTQQIQIASYQFVGNTLADEVISVVKSDLTRTGLFSLLDIQQRLADTATPVSADIRKSGADYALWGAIYKTADGKYDARYKILDILKNVTLDASSVVITGDARTAGHILANRIYEKLLGHKGFFLSKLAYVTQRGADQYELRVADWDGQNPATALRSKEPIISPTFSPDNTKLAYVSFESRKANIIIHELATGTRSVLANYKGTNSAPSYAHNGKTIAAALSRDGLAQIYLLPIDSSPPKRVSFSSGIDTEPTFSPNSETLYFVSDRGGQPQIYNMAVNGGSVQRVTFKGDYNISPAVSPDGKLLAYVTRRDGRFVTAILDLASQQETLVSDTGFDESPVFTSNGRFVMYASKIANKGVLILASVDGRIRTVLSSNAADIREPALSK